MICKLQPGCVHYLLTSMYSAISLRVGSSTGTTRNNHKKKFRTKSYELNTTEPGAHVWQWVNLVFKRWNWRKFLIQQLAKSFIYIFSSWMWIPYTPGIVNRTFGNQTQIQSFDWFGLSSVIEHNWAHQNTLPIEHNRTFDNRMYLHLNVIEL